MKKSIVLFLCFASICTQAQNVQQLLFGANKVVSAKPLQDLVVNGVKGSHVKVYDGSGTLYASLPLKGLTCFRVGGTLGRHTVKLFNTAGQITDTASFLVDARTDIDDGGYYKKMFGLFYSGMFADEKSGSFEISWNGKKYHVFVPWVLDNFQTMKGKKYFLPNARELIDMMRQSQRADGMIYSFVQYMQNADYFLTRDKLSGYSKKIEDRVFVRQPSENHPEYLYLNTIYDCWKSEGDDVWMKKNLASAAKALDYSIKDPARWSKRFQLLKRVYTIDSWDFAVEDEYMPDIGITNTMMIDPVKSKFGVFFGDNTGYITACYQLAEMFRYSGDTVNALKYKNRGNEIKQRLDKLSWNGNFFTHFIDEDSTVIRKLGVDEKLQVAQSNAYSLNRDISAIQSKAIIETYLNIKKNLPVGSPGEWYAIYPPFQKGFVKHDAVWQYMNGGVGGHVAGELSRGAYQNGYERYGTDILNRLYELGEKYDHKIWFAYTGSIPPPPPPPEYKPLDLRAYANMDLSSQHSERSLSWMGSMRPGDDIDHLPVGAQHFAGIRFNVIDPAQNYRKAVVAVSKQKGFPESVEIPVNDSAGCIYLLHTSGKPASENIAGALKFVYSDGSSKVQYISMGKHLSYWWFPDLKTEYSGVAWYGKNAVSEGIGLSWCAIDNPEPHKKISRMIVQSPEGNSIYTVLAITLANREHYVPVKATSFGGPDDWAASTAMAAMVEGLAGVKDAPATEAFSGPVVSPRWITTTSDTVNVTVRYAASAGYVAYRYIHDKNKKQLKLSATGSGNNIRYHILLPPDISQIKGVFVNKKPVEYTKSVAEQSTYVDFTVSGRSAHEIIVSY